jgi:trehalose-phosphatase
MIALNADNVERFAEAVGTRLDGSPLAVMLDIDGTLAPIAPTPDEASIPDVTRDVLRNLTALPGVAVVLVSGRSVDDAIRFVNGQRWWIVGNHGLELRTPEGQLSADESARQFRANIESAARELSAIARSTRGAILENKALTLSLHYRLADPSAVSGLMQRARDVAATHGLKVTQGKKIVELRPPVEVDKGTAALTLADRLGALSGEASVFYAGDDRTDEDAFRALRGRTKRAVTLRVVSDEDQPTTSAEFQLSSPTAVRKVLEWLAERRARV